MMNFRVVKNAVRDLLGNAAAGNYQVAGFQRQEKRSEAYTGNNRLVQVYFKNENFDANKSKYNGPTIGDVSISIELTVSAPSRADLTVIDNPASTQQQVQDAMALLIEASQEADDEIDELFELVYQVLMDARNIDLDLPIGTLSNRWVSSLSKDTTNPRGQLVVLTGSVEFSCRVEENVLGDTGEDLTIINMENDINNDTVQKTGFEI